MEPNPVLKRLGLKSDDRVVIIHTDGIGMCQASVSAFADLTDFGLISSGAVMVPCAWFPLAAHFCRLHPEVDMGVHLTLTSEWEFYRWGPVSTHDPATGLLDDQGFFYRTSIEAQKNGDPSAVQVEVQAQVARAEAFGICPTHIDTHMGAMAHPKFQSVYLQLALAQHTAAMVFRMSEAQYRAIGLDAQSAATAVQMVQMLEQQGIPLLDHLRSMPLNDPKDRVQHTQRVLSELPPGITHFIIHPSKDTPELRQVTTGWASRVADYQTFTSEEMRRWLKGSGLHVIGYRALQELMPNR